MGESSGSPKPDPLLADLISRAGRDTSTRLSALFQNFLDAKSKCSTLVAGLRDSITKKNELAAELDGMALMFCNLGLLCTAVATSNQALTAQIGQQAPTFADLTKVPKVTTAKGKQIAPAPKQAVLIVPDDDNSTIKTADDTKQVLLTRLKPGDVGMNPDRILKSGKQGVRLEGATFDMAKVNKDRLKSAGLKAIVPGKLKPRLALFGVPNEFDAPEIKEQIVSYFDDFTEMDIEVKAKFGPRDKSYSHWVLETSADLRGALLRSGRVYIGWSSCFVKDHLRVLRCYNCQKFGHSQANCNGDVHCGHCAGGHDTRKCPNEHLGPTCINCQLAGLKDNIHSAGSLSCHIYNKKVRDLISNTDYGQ